LAAKARGDPPNPPATVSIPPTTMIKKTLQKIEVLLIGSSALRENTISGLLALAVFRRGYH
jgi:hypothetical protein